MAVEYGWTGFEGGSADACQADPLRGAIIGTGLRAPRTGQFMYSAVSGDSSVNVWLAYRRKTTAMGVGETSTTFFRVFARLNQQVGTTGCVIAGLGALSFTGQRVSLALDTSGHFAIWLGTAFSSYSAAALSVGTDTWYRLDGQVVITATGGGSCSVTGTITVYTEDGTLVEAVTRSESLAVAAELPVALTLANGGFNSSTLDCDFDDWWWAAANGADQATLAFPSATRITRVPATAQGTASDWTGDYRRIIDCPQESQADDQTCAAIAGATSTFLHASAATHGISGIAGIIVRSQLRLTTGSTGTEALLLNSVAYPVTVPQQAFYNYTAQEAIVYAAMSTGTFDAAEFGARNVRGSGAMAMAICYMEVLHSGVSQPAPYATVTEAWRLNILSYVGNGGYQTIAGMGFGAQVLQIKPATGGSNTGGIKLARMGGTWLALDTTGGGRAMNAVLGLTNDGFLLGPSVHANAAGVLYLAIGIRDGGGAGAYYLSTATRIGNAPLDNQAVVLPNGFPPDLVWNMAQTSGPIYRTSVMVGDVAIGISGLATITNLIQAMLATGFEVGSATQTNGQNTAQQVYAMRIGAALLPYVAVGTITPGGTSATITGIPFSPQFVACQRQGNSNSGFWRAPLIHATADSTQYANGNVSATAITSITADGFVVGAALASAGVPLFWVAYTAGELTPPPPVDCADDWGIPRPDGLPYVPLMPPV